MTHVSIFKEGRITMTWHLPKKERDHSKYQGRSDVSIFKEETITMTWHVPKKERDNSNYEGRVMCQL